MLTISKHIESYTSKRKYIGRMTLKMIALTSMIIDHTGHAILEPYLDAHVYILLLYCILRSIGRIAFPLYGFMLAEGMNHTHNLKQYVCRLWIFAIVSEIPYDYMNGFDNYLSTQNVGFTLALAATAEYLSRHYPEGRYGIWLTAAAAAILCGADYGGLGIFMIFALTMKNEWIRIFAIGLILEQSFYNLYGLAFMNIVSTLICLSIIETVFHKYNPNTKMNRTVGSAFYGVYPVHMIIFGVIKNVIQRFI